MNIVKRARMAGAAVVVAWLVTAAGSQAALGAEPGFGSLFLNGQVVGTVVPPAQVSPGSGRDPFYKVTNAVGGQLGIAGVGPGEPGFHGGDWEVFTVTFNGGHPARLLTSGAAVAQAEANGDVTVTRHPEQDFRCPITGS